MTSKARAVLWVVPNSIVICGKLPIRLCTLRCTPWLHLTRSVANYTYGHHASAVSVLATNVDPSSSDYREKAQQMTDAVNRMKCLHEEIEAGGPWKARDKHVARGKMLPREYLLTVGLLSEEINLSLS